MESLLPNSLTDQLITWFEKSGDTEREQQHFPNRPVFVVLCSDLSRLEMLRINLTYARQSGPLSCGPSLEKLDSVAMVIKLCFIYFI